MLKLAPCSALKSVRAVSVLMLALMLPLAHGLADASPSGSPSGSFKSGFSSQRAASSSSPSPSKGSFGSFGRRSSPASAPPPGRADAPPPRNGGFGSFGRGAAPDARRSDSALSQKLDRDAAEARALRTLDERRAAQAARNAPPPRQDDGRDTQRNDPRQRNDLPPPGYANGPAPDYGRGQPPVIVRQDNGLGRVIAGAVIANAAANAAAHAANANRGNGGVPMQPAPAPAAPSWNGGVDSVNAQVTPPGSAAAHPAPARGGSVFGTLAVLAVLALLGWAAYKMIMRARAKRAADKPNYSFERN